MSNSRNTQTADERTLAERRAELDTPAERIAFDNDPANGTTAERIAAMLDRRDRLAFTVSAASSGRVLHTGVSREFVRATLHKANVSADGLDELDAGDVETFDRVYRVAVVAVKAGS